MLQKKTNKEKRNLNPTKKTSQQKNVLLTCVKLYLSSLA